MTNVAACGVPLASCSRALSSSAILSSEAFPRDVRRAARDFSGLYGEGLLAPSSSEACRSGRFRLLAAGAITLSEEWGCRWRKEGRSGCG